LWNAVWAVGYWNRRPEFFYLTFAELGAIYRIQFMALVLYQLYRAWTFLKKITLPVRFCYEEQKTQVQITGSRIIILYTGETVTTWLCCGHSQDEKRAYNMLLK
jgi:hypothetical protein